MSLRRRSTRDEWPLRLLINGEDVTFQTGEGFTFSSTHPGGYEAASFPLPKDLPWVERGQPVRLECGAAIVWLGRVKEVQRSLGNTTLIQCEGLKAEADEFLFVEIFVDRDLTKWGGMSLSREEVILLEGPEPNTYNSPNTPSVGVSYNAEEPALKCEVTTWTKDEVPLYEAWYRAPLGKVTIGLVWAACAGTFKFGTGKLAVEPEVGVTSDPQGIIWNGESFNPLKPANYSYPSGASLALLRWKQPANVWESPGAKPTKELTFTRVAVFGTHGLTRHFPAEFGSAEEQPGELLITDIAAFLAKNLATASQMIVVGEVQGSTEPIPHLIWEKLTGYGKALEQLATYLGWHYGIWGTPHPISAVSGPNRDTGYLIFAKPPGEGEPTVWAWRNQCEALDLRESLDKIYNVAEVEYTDASGEAHVVSVPVQNPVLAHLGITRTIALSMGLATEATAILYGELQLRALYAEQFMAGQTQITEPIQQMNGAPIPAWQIRPGLDRLKVVDLPSQYVGAFGASSDRLVTRMECTGGSSGLTTHLEFGLGVNLIEQMTAKLEAFEHAAN